VADDENVAQSVPERLNGVDGIRQNAMFGGLAFLLHRNVAVEGPGVFGDCSNQSTASAMPPPAATARARRMVAAQRSRPGRISAAAARRCSPRAVPKTMKLSSRPHERSVAEGRAGQPAYLGS
jgi:hypothetical protein